MSVIFCLAVTFLIISVFLGIIFRPVVIDFWHFEDHFVGLEISTVDLALRLVGGLIVIVAIANRIGHRIHILLDLVLLGLYLL